MVVRASSREWAAKSIAWTLRLAVANVTLALDESVDAYVPSKAIPQPVLMDVLGGVIDLKVPAKRICPASNDKDKG